MGPTIYWNRELNISSLINTYTEYKCSVSLIYISKSFLYIIWKKKIAVSKRIFLFGFPLIFIYVLLLLVTVGGPLLFVLSPSLSICRKPLALLNYLLVHVLNTLVLPFSMLRPDAPVYSCQLLSWTAVDRSILNSFVWEYKLLFISSWGEFVLKSMGNWADTWKPVTDMNIFSAVVQSESLLIISLLLWSPHWPKYGKSSEIKGFLSHGSFDQKGLWNFKCWVKRFGTFWRYAQYEMNRETLHMQKFESCTPIILATDYIFSAHFDSCLFWKNKNWNINETYNTSITLS